VRRYDVEAAEPHDGRSNKHPQRREGEDPGDRRLVDGVPVGQAGLDAGERALGVGRVDPQADLAVEVGNVVHDV
jgi:hypothetical protein